MPQVTGSERVQAALKAKLLAMKLDKDPSVVVGYTAAYALPVHERTDVYHANGQAKFLEEPFRTLPLGDLVLRAMKAGASLEQALLIAGLRLQREAMILTPVDTGNLKGSAFTELEK